MKLVSVVVPSYNHEAFIIESLDSILAQSYEHIQLVIVDDGSTDDSVNVISDYLKVRNVKNVKFIKQKNSGVSEAINTGIANSDGEYICLLASDDILHPWSVAEMLEKFDNEAIGMVFGDASLINSKGDRLLIPLDPNKITDSFLEWRLQKAIFLPFNFADIRRCLYERNFIPPIVMLKKEILLKVGVFNADLRLEDHEMWLRISRKYRIIFHDRVVGKYRIHGLNTIFKSNRVLFCDTISVLIAEREFVTNTDDLFLLNKRISRLIISYIKNYKFSIFNEGKVLCWLKQFLKSL